eukprot:140288-Pelagomonas_calceolata.AAC.2
MCGDDLDARVSTGRGALFLANVCQDDLDARVSTGTGDICGDDLDAKVSTGRGCDVRVRKCSWHISQPSSWQTYVKMT